MLFQIVGICLVGFIYMYVVIVLARWFGMITKLTTTALKVEVLFLQLHERCSLHINQHLEMEKERALPLIFFGVRKVKSLHIVQLFCIIKLYFHKGLVIF